MKAIKLLLCTLLIIAFVSGCKDDEKSNTDLLLGTWMMTGYTVMDSTSAFHDYFALFAPCQKDDHFIFQNGGHYISDKDSLCNSGDPQQTTGTWEFSNSETVLTIIDTTNHTPLSIDTTVLNISELSESLLKATFPDGSSGGTATVTLEKM